MLAGDDPRHARAGDQLGQVAVPVRRAGQRQDHDRRDDRRACWAATIFVPYAVEVERPDHGACTTRCTITRSSGHDAGPLQAIEWTPAG